MSDTSRIPDEALNDTARDEENVPPEDDGADAEQETPAVLGAGIDFTDPNSPLAPLYLRGSHVLFVTFLAVLFAWATHWPVFHTDVWAHLRFGEAIVKTRALPAHEDFPESFADHEAPYIHYQWLAQAGAYLVFAAGEALSAPDADARLGGGALMLSTAHGLIVVLRLVLLFVAFRRLTGSPAAAAAGAFLVALMGAFVHLYILRPQILGELAFAAVLAALARPVLSRRALVLVPLVFLLWANCHGSFPMGWVVLGAALAGRAAEAARDAAGGYVAALSSPGAALAAAVSDVATRRLAAVLVLSVAATAINPHGPALLYESWALSKNPNIPFMEEWKPLPPLTPVGVVFLASVLLLAPLLRLSPARFTPTQVLLLLGFGLQSVAHARVVVWWCMVFVFAALPHLDAVARRLIPRWAEDRSVPSFRKTALAALVAAVFVVGWSAPSLWMRFDDSAPRGSHRVTAVTPVKAAEQIRARHAPDKKLFVFASETMGDYLLWALRDLEPPVRLSCYTHVHLFPPEHWRKCFAVKSGDRHWQRILDEWGADVLVLDYDVHSGGKPGGFDLIDKVKKSGAWTVVPGFEKPVFVAERKVPLQPGR